MSHINSALFPKMTLQIREDRFNIPLGKHRMCLHELLVFIRSVLLKQISRLSLLTALWFIAHRRHLAQHGFLSDETKMKYTWKSHFMHPSHSPGEIVLKKERKIRKEHTNPREMCAECVSGSYHQLQPHRAVWLLECSCRPSQNCCRLLLGMCTAARVYHSKEQILQNITFHSEEVLIGRGKTQQKNIFLKKIKAIGSSQQTLQWDYCALLIALLVYSGKNFSTISKTRKILSWYINGF